MSHTDPVILALLALGETAVAADDAGHAETCPRCRAELARLTEVVELARNDISGERLEMPPPRVWDRIAAAVGPGQAVGDPGRRASRLRADAQVGVVLAGGRWRRQENRAL